MLGGFILWRALKNACQNKYLVCAAKWCWTMHFEHHPAKMMQVDFAGDLLYYVDPSSGELIACPVFIAVLPLAATVMWKRCQI